jgi:LruC domain-containing protein
MSDETDNTEWGIDRRTVLKGAAAVSGAGLVGLSATGTAAADEQCGPGCEPQCEAQVPLCAGQDIDVGTVHIRRVPGEDELEVEYVLDGETENDWYLRETHLYVGKTDPTELSSAPGQFPFSKEDYGDNVTSDTYTIGFDEVCEYAVQQGNKWDEETNCGVEAGDCVWVAAHAVVDEVLIEAPYFAADATSTANQGVKKNGESVDSDRSDPADALVKAYPDGNFFSLGFMPDGEGGFQDEGGSIEVTFECPVVNGEGDDLRLWEVTFAPYPPESADVYAWYEGGWRLLGTADNSGQDAEGSPEAHTLSTFDLSDPADEDYDEIESTEKLRIVDTTDPGPHNGSADAFDLDGIQVLQDCTEDETAWGDGCDGCEITDGGNWATKFQYGIGECLETLEVPSESYIGYEDRPSSGDFDYNDFGMRASITETYLGDELETIDMEFSAEEYQAGDSHVISIQRDFLSSDTMEWEYELSRSGSDDLSSSRTTDETNGPVGGSGSLDVALFDTDTLSSKTSTIDDTVSITVTITSGAENQPSDSPRPDVAANNVLFEVYDTVMEPDGAAAVGLSTVQTGITSGDIGGNVTENWDKEADVPNIIVVPDVDFDAPAEATTISTDYPEFDDYYAGGTTDDGVIEVDNTYDDWFDTS